MTLSPGLPAARHPSTTSGFALSGLLITAVLGVTVVTAAATLLVGHTRSTTQTLQRQERRTDWRKLSYLLSTELAEARQLSFGVAMPGSCSGSTSLFTIQVPSVNTAGTSSSLLQIHYYQSGSGSQIELRRCGPPVLSSGALDPTPGSISDALIIPGIPITGGTLSSCSRCYTLQPNLASAAENNSLGTIVLRPGLREITVPGP